MAIEQVRLERSALPEENVTAVFDQMRAERRQFAAKFQAEGEHEASRIRSEAELEAARIRAKGAEEAARIRGEVGGPGRQDLCRRAPRRPGALPIHPVARLARQAHDWWHVAHSPDRLRAVLPAAEQGPAVRKIGPPSEIGALGRAARSRCSMGRGSACTGGSARWRCSTRFPGSRSCRPDEVAVVLRWGRLVGDTPALAAARGRAAVRLPRPIDRSRPRPGQAHLGSSGLHARREQTSRRTDRGRGRGRGPDNTLDPLTQGYALTGDQNIVQCRAWSPATAFATRPNGRSTAPIGGRAARRGDVGHGAFARRNGSGPRARGRPKGAHRHRRHAEPRRDSTRRTRAWNSPRSS